METKTKIIIISLGVILLVGPASIGAYSLYKNWAQGKAQKELQECKKSGRDLLCLTDLTDLAEGVNKIPCNSNKDCSYSNMENNCSMLDMPAGCSASGCASYSIYCGEDNFCKYCFH